MADVVPQAVAASPRVLSDNASDTLRGIGLALLAYLIWTLGDATATLKSLFGFAAVTPASDIAAGAMYTRLHVTMFVLAAVLVWRALNTWTFTSRITLPRAVAAISVVAVSILMMWTQSANPFLYFQF